MTNANCLGLYIDENIIKYAKVSKEHNKIKVDSFGVKFYDEINEAISQVIQETYSQRTPISINLASEMYNYFDMFALLTKNDLQKAIKTEFNSYCVEKGYNPNVFENRYVIVENQEDKEKIKVIHISENKIELNRIMQQVEGYKLINISPISMSITNLLDTEKQEDCVIVNIEDKTTVTTILQNKIYNIESIEEGSKDFLNKISLRENSYAKSYEICKNTTIYTSEGRELQETQTENLEDIMPTLYTIVGKVKNIIEQSTTRIRKIYLTGTAALINNIDLYFEEYFEDVQCEILKPHFIENTRDISIKDFTEVNSAISMALMGIGEGIEGINFKELKLIDKMPEWLTKDKNPEKERKGKKIINNIFSWDLGSPLDKVETTLIRTSVGILLFAIIYSSFSAILADQMNKKKQEAQNSIDNTTQQILSANADDDKIKEKKNDYNELIDNLKKVNEAIEDRNKRRNAIPNLLNQIMSIVPENVQLASIENSSNTHIIITAQSNKYEPLGIFKAKIKLDNILRDTISTAGQKDNGVVTIKIEGELP